MTMSKKNSKSIIVGTDIKTEIVTNMIFLVRGQKVMFDSHLASLYGVETKQLKRAVKRNFARFPEDFMFELTKDEYESLKSEERDNLRCQNGASSWGGVRYLPYAFTEQGVAMLSSVLNSDRAIQVNIAIMRVFVQLRQLISSHKDLLGQLKKIERRVGQHDAEIKAIIELIRRLHTEPQKSRKGIGFHVK